MLIATTFIKGQNQSGVVFKNPVTVEKRRGEEEKTTEAAASLFLIKRHFPPRLEL